MKFWIIIFLKVDAYRKMSQSVRNIFRESRENIVPYYSQNIRLHMLFALKLSGKTSEEKYAASLGTKAK